MSIDVSQILQQYQAADEEERNRMYMYYNWLRPELDEIEREIRATEEPEKGE